MESLGRPTILFVSLEHESWFEEMYASLIDKISSKAAIQRAKKPDAFMRYMQATRPSAILLTDGALSRGKNSNVLDKLIEYTKSGGTMVVMGHFSGFVSGDEFNYFFGRLGLGWEMGVYQREDMTRPRLVLQLILCVIARRHCVLK